MQEKNYDRIHKLKSEMGKKENDGLFFISLNNTLSSYPISQFYRLINI
jgi:hypothetical protein